MGVEESSMILWEGDLWGVGSDTWALVSDPWGMVSDS